jgi:hypothetical protein
VIAYDEGGGEAASADFVEGQGFTLSLAPGTYRVVGVSGEAVCSSKTVTVEADTLETIRFRCGVR